MDAAKLLLAVLASTFFMPVSCTVTMIPAARMVASATTRDVGAGEEPYRARTVPLFDAATGDLADVVAIADVRTALSASPSLTPRPRADGVDGEPGDQYRWRIESTAGDAQVVAFSEVRENFAHTFRYRVDDGGIAPLTSHLWAVTHAFYGFFIGLLAAFGVRVAARRARARRSAPPAVP